MREKTTLASLSPYVPGKPLAEVQQAFDLAKVVKLASNENPFGSSKKVQAALKEALGDLEYYPDGGAKALKTKLVEFLGVKENQLLIGAGLDDVIQIISRSLLNPGDEIIVADPTFSQYELHGVIEGAEVVKVPVDSQGLMDLAGMLAAITDQTKIIWLCNPNNPTGTYIPQREIASFIAKVPSDVLVISDEAYQEYVTCEAESTSLPLLGTYANLLVMRTFSKAYGLAGLRIGYAVIPEQLGRAFEIVRPPFNTSSLAQRGAIVALEDQSFIAQTVAVNRLEMAKWETFMAAHGLTYYTSQANFIFFDTQKDSHLLAQKLMATGFIVRAGLRPGWLRITVGHEEDNQQLRQTLAPLLASEQ
ncbi:histidinol-phosphate transaminase [uncultured Vagococcus sp.]|uniref:histidinol-phosphate transaminase n=1 Tax=uncultured Vagococcus sp. TaxID=189676 RepID=UPI0028D3FAD7|nr:histidinol-phosphate transaminase [uncultured Vagococcus sp.]